MKIVLGIHSYNKKILRIDEILTSMGHQVRVFQTDNYRNSCSYCKKRLDKLGIHKYRNEFERTWKDHFKNTLEEFSPDVVLFINPPNGVLSPKEFMAIKENHKVIGWLVDSIQWEGSRLWEYCSGFSKLYAFEKRDLSYIKEKCGIDAVYFPLGYNNAYQTNSLNQVVKDIDVLFIGSAYKNRFITLDYVAKYAELNNWKLQIYGPLLQEHFWKNIKNKLKYPHIFKHLHNVTISSEEAASLYKRSKICLNIHTSHHKGINPRTFEILATNSFELIDEREDYAGIVEPGKDLVSYRSDEDLVEMIGHYLPLSDERALIARNGYEKVNERWSMETCLNNILS